MAPSASRWTTTHDVTMIRSAPALVIGLCLIIGSVSQLGFLARLHGDMPLLLSAALGLAYAAGTIIATYAAGRAYKSYRIGDTYGMRHLDILLVLPAMWCLGLMLSGLIGPFPNPSELITLEWVLPDLSGFADRVPAVLALTTGIVLSTVPCFLIGYATRSPEQAFHDAELAARDKAERAQRKAERTTQGAPTAPSQRTRS